MGISYNIACHLARVAPRLAGLGDGVMLGRQKLHLRPPARARLIEQLRGMGIAAGPGTFPEDGWCEPFFEAIGWPPMQSLDFSAIEGARFIHDLAQPVGDDLRGRFDLVYDGGTTEHVFDIAQAFRNVDAMLREGGVFVSCVGSDGWFGHGFYQVGPDVPWRYFGAHLGYEVLGCWTFPRRAAEAPLEIPDPTGAPRGAERRFERPQFLFYMVRKTGARPAPGPVIQSHYVDY